MPIPPISVESKNSSMVDHKDTVWSINVLYMQVHTMSGIVIDFVVFPTFYYNTSYNTESSYKLRMQFVY